ncbi:MAG TPA: SDR family oxidoreductase [Burkholderiaceae bacterium]|nr:SDR family oxidoreductase [Burkholderiaceae bacterium]
MKVFVTGHKGYIGAHLVDLLKQAGHGVTGCDLGLFDGCAWEPIVPVDRDLRKDIRDVTINDLAGHDCVMHLAALSNDPMGELDAAATYAINRDSSIRIAQLAKKAGVPRYLFAASCSVYGAGEKLDLDETDRLNPLTAYAKSKIDTELAVSALADHNFTPVYLRNATAYGHSPMLRIDLVVNNLLACAAATGDIRIMSDGSPWRPLIHCRDIARAFIAFMTAPKNRVHNVAVNVGGNAENYQVRDVAEQVKRLVPTAKIVYTGEIGIDPRNYRVKFDLLNKLLPDFKLQYNLATGMDELYRKLIEHRFDKADWEGDQFVRLRALKRRLHLLKNVA